MEYVIYSPGLKWNGDTVKTEALGGSESAAYYLARELAARGHRVKVFTQHPGMCVADDVQYYPAGDATSEHPLGRNFEFYARSTPHDVLVMQRVPNAFAAPFASKLNVLQLHDVATYRNAAAFSQSLARVDIVTGVSQFHVDQVNEVYGRHDSIMRVVPNGVDPALYDASSADMPEFAMLYQSRPERGLLHLVRPDGIMQRLRDAGSTAHLYVCGYENTLPEMAQFYAQLNAWADALPNVTRLGTRSKADLARIQKGCKLLCYPTEFIEVSCITAMEAMHARLPLLSSACGALPETCADSGAILLPLDGQEADEVAFVREILRLESAPAELAALSAKQGLAAQTRTWVSAVDTFEAAIAAAFAARQQHHGAMMRHMIEHSDIVAATEYARRNPEAQGRIFETARAELALYEDIESARVQEYYDHDNAVYLNEIANYDRESRLAGGARSARVLGVMGLVNEEVALKGKLRVLDYGCSLGMLSCAMARTHPHSVDITAMDISDSVLAVARDDFAAEGLGCVTFVRGDHSAIHGTYDLIVAGEVAEHVWDVRAFLETLRSHLAPGGALILTTPHGRWEWMSFRDSKRRRQHVHHFEKRDLRELFAGHDVELTYAPGGSDGAGGAIGNWITRVRFLHDEPIGTIDYARKFAEMIPRETVTLCMIAKDAARDIGSAIDSVVRWVDEVRVAIDEASTDATVAVIERKATDNPHVAFSTIAGVAAMKDGFSAARNRSIEHADGSWVLWMDADEVVHRPEAIWPLLRRSGVSAFGVAQTHYSVDPPMVLTTDYPCRLFRNDRGVKFYGLVHEHPEDAPGRAIDGAVMCGDFSFLHNGYIDESVRRRRFARNFPLLERDMVDNPDRALNKFLYLRDMAQMVKFEAEQTGGRVSPNMVANCERGIEIFDALVHDPRPVLRMVVDSLQYYTVCVETLQRGFYAGVTINTSCPTAPSLASCTNVQARFADAGTFTALINRIQSEATQHYGSRYC